MFLTDTVDAADGESFSQSPSILDRLADLILETGPSEEVGPNALCGLTILTTILICTDISTHLSFGRHPPGETSSRVSDNVHNTQRIFPSRVLGEGEHAGL